MMRLAGRRRLVGRRVLCVHCHPDPDSLMSSAHAVTITALSQAGIEVRTIDLYGQGFDPLMSVDDWSDHARQHEPVG